MGCVYFPRDAAEAAHWLNSGVLDGGPTHGLAWLSRCEAEAAGPAPYEYILRWAASIGARDLWYETVTEQAVATVALRMGRLGGQTQKNPASRS